MWFAIKNSIDGHSVKLIYNGTSLQAAFLYKFNSLPLIMLGKSAWFYQIVLFIVVMLKILYMNLWNTDYIIYPFHIKLVKLL